MFLLPHLDFELRHSHKILFLANGLQLRPSTKSLQNYTGENDITCSALRLMLTCISCLNFAHRRKMDFTYIFFSLAICISRPVLMLLSELPTPHLACMMYFLVDFLHEPLHNLLYFLKLVGFFTFPNCCVCSQFLT